MGTGKSYCTGSDVFTAIVGQVKRYKGESCGFIDDQFKYIADIMINFIERVFTFIQVKMLKIFSLLIHLKIIKIFYIA